MQQINDETKFSWTQNRIRIEYLSSTVTEHTHLVFSVDCFCSKRLFMVCNSPSCFEVELKKTECAVNVS